MRFLFCSLESPGFLYPAIGLAKALAQRGHEIIFASDVQTASPLEASGFVRFRRGEPEGNSFLVGQWSIPARVAIQVKHIENALREFPADALVGQSLTLGPLIAGERRSLPVGLMGFCTYLWPFPGAAAADEGRTRDEARLIWRYHDMLKWLNEARWLFRLPPLPCGIDGNPLLGDLFLVRSVAELEPDLCRLPERVHLVGACLWEPPGVDPEVEIRLAEIESSKLPVIYVQHGRFFHVPRFWPKIREALGDLPFWVVASSDRLDDEVGVLPRNFVVRPHIPQERVLRKASAVIASANSTAVLGALAAGLPSLLIPGGGEQPDVAELCEWAGVARVLDPTEVTAESILKALEALLTDESYRRRAALYKTAFSRVDGFEPAADLLELLAATRKPVVRRVRSQDCRPTSASAAPFFRRSTGRQ